MVAASCNSITARCLVSSDANQPQSDLLTAGGNLHWTTIDCLNEV